jgi:hypothetical protein
MGVRVKHAGVGVQGQLRQGGVWLPIAGSWGCSRWGQCKRPVWPEGRHRGRGAEGDACRWTRAPFRTRGGSGRALRLGLSRSGPF